MSLPAARLSFSDRDRVSCSGSTVIIETRGFPPLPHDRFGFTLTPNSNYHLLLGARYARFDMIPHNHLLNIKMNLKFATINCYIFHVKKISGKCQVKTGVMNRIKGS
jgi:hypothetical protein